MDENEHAFDRSIARSFVRSFVARLQATHVMIEKQIYVYKHKHEERKKRRDRASKRGTNY